MTDVMTGPQNHKSGHWNFFPRPDHQAWVVGRMGVTTISRFKPSRQLKWKASSPNSVKGITVSDSQQICGYFQTPSHGFLTQNDQEEGKAVGSPPTRSELPGPAPAETGWIDRGGPHDDIFFWRKCVSLLQHTMWALFKQEWVAFQTKNYSIQRICVASKRRQQLKNPHQGPDEIQSGPT